MTVDRFFVDITNRQILISFTLDEDDSTHKYSLADIYVDMSDTFVCSNEQSQLAIKIPASDLEKWVMDHLPEGSIITDISDLTQIKVENYPLSFDNIYSDNIDNDLFFLYVYENISEKGDVPKRTDNPIFATTFSVAVLYKHLLSILKSVKKTDCSCSADCNTVVPLLFYEGFLKAIDLQMYKKAIEYWNLLHRETKTVNNTCGCNG